MSRFREPQSNLTERDGDAGQPVRLPGSTFRCLAANREALQYGRKVRNDGRDVGLIEEQPKGQPLTGRGIALYDALEAEVTSAVAGDVERQMAVHVLEVEFAAQVLVQRRQILVEPFQFVRAEIANEGALEGMSPYGNPAADPVPIPVVGRSGMRSTEHLHSEVVRAWMPDDCVGSLHDALGRYAIGQVAWR